MFTRIMSKITGRKIIWLKLHDGSVEYTLENKIDKFQQRTCYRFWLTRICLIVMLPEGKCKQHGITYINEWREE